MSRNLSFIDACLAGEAILDEIDDYIERWHHDTTSPSVLEYLGMSQQEYQLWVERPESLRFILAAREDGIDAIEFFARQVRAQPIAARKGEDVTAEAIRRWLTETGRINT